jgi:hypothetical protein
MKKDHKKSAKCNGNNEIIPKKTINLWNIQYQIVTIENILGIIVIHIKH